MAKVKVADYHFKNEEYIEFGEIELDTDYTHLTVIKYHSGSSLYLTKGDARNKTIRDNGFSPNSGFIGEKDDSYDKLWDIFREKEKEYKKQFKGYVNL